MDLTDAHPYKCSRSNESSWQSTARRRERMSSREIVVTDRDLWWLRALVRTRARTAARDQQHLEQLEAELERAHTIDPAELPDGVVTMHARMRVRDIGTGA